MSKARFEASSTLPPTGNPGVEISVRYTAGAHVTNTIHGKRASSTSSADEAARSLACKLFKDVPFTLVKTHVEPGRDVFTVIGDLA